MNIRLQPILGVNLSSCIVTASNYSTTGSNYSTTEKE
jgi:hypothetical protein